MDYRKRFEDLADRIRGDSARVLLYASFGPPADPAVLEAARDRHFGGRDSAVLAFHAAMDGVSLYWNDAGRPEPDREYPPLLLLRKDLRFDGVINILPLATALDPATWKGTVWFENDSQAPAEFLGATLPKAALRRHLFPFDLFSTDMSMALYLGTDPERVLLLQDYHVAYGDSRVTDFATYLEFLLASEGRTAARLRAFNALNGHRLPSAHLTDLLEAL